MPDPCSPEPPSRRGSEPEPLAPQGRRHAPGPGPRAAAGAAATRRAWRGPTPCGGKSGGYAQAKTVGSGAGIRAPVLGEPEPLRLPHPSGVATRTAGEVGLGVGAWAQEPESAWVSRAGRSGELSDGAAPQPQSRAGREGRQFAQLVPRPVLPCPLAVLASSQVRAAKVHFQRVLRPFAKSLACLLQTQGRGRRGAALQAR